MNPHSAHYIVSDLPVSRTEEKARPSTQIQIDRFAHFTTPMMFETAALAVAAPVHFLVLALLILLLSPIVVFGHRPIFSPISKSRSFHADAIDPNSRTLLIEVDVRNPTGELLPGSYATVHVKLASKVRAVNVPANALLFRSEGLRVAVVHNGRTDLVPVVLGHDYGDKMEVVSGITPHDCLIVNPSDSIVSGERVQIAGATTPLSD